MAKEIVKSTSRGKISVRTSLILAGIGLAFELLPVPLVGGASFWLLLAAYLMLFWRFVFRRW